MPERGVDPVMLFYVLNINEIYNSKDQKNLLNMEFNSQIEKIFAKTSDKNVQTDGLILKRERCPFEAPSRILKLSNYKKV